MTSILLPQGDGKCAPYQLKGTPHPISCDGSGIQKRVAYAAAHVVVDPLADVHPSSDCAIDFEATMAYRRHLWSMGFGVAEAMDTAQRGMGLRWEHAQALMSRSIAEAKTLDARVACGAGTDQLPVSPNLQLSDVLRAYEEQCAFIEGLGGSIILMASRALAAVAKDPDDYRRVYGHVLSKVSRPVILHWLGDMFDPALRGYWGYTDVERAMDVCLGVIEDNASKIDGIKISLLSADHEIQMRRRLPSGVRMYTGDDFNYPDLILGDSEGHSDALLGIFDAIAPVAATALRALDEGDVERYNALLAPTVPLSRTIFSAPTQFYKTGVVFLAYLNGHQSHFRMVGGLESMRSVPHLSAVFRLADAAGLLADPEQACDRMKRWLALAGVV